MSEPGRLKGFQVKLLRDRLTAIEQEISDDESDEDIGDMQLHYGTEGMKVEAPFNPFRKIFEDPSGKTPTKEREPLSGQSRTDEEPLSDESQTKEPAPAHTGSRVSIAIQLAEEDIDEAMLEDDDESDKEGSKVLGKKKRRWCRKKKKKKPKDSDSEELSKKNDEEEEDMEPPPYTGMFDDGVRRVDYILVVADDNSLEVEHIKVSFMMSLLKLGLELEIVSGVMNRHRHLLFIKVHAPDKVLLEFAEAYAVRKYFKDVHLSLMKSGFLHERAWIKLVRKNYIKPLRYSNFERSYIVHMLMYHQPFGDQYVNYYGIHKLLKNNIILDAYALHDGPYFFLKEQDFSRINARQILFYNWVGLDNVFTHQPLNLIYEYFGSRISFYFALYEYYNQFLLVLTVIILILQLLSKGYNKMHSVEKIYKKFQEALEGKLVYEEEHPKNLEACPLKYYDFYEPPSLRDLHVSTVLNDELLSTPLSTIIPQQDVMILYSALLCILATFFYVMWKRKEKYWIWIWELGHRPKYPIMRPEYKFNRRTARRMKQTGAWKTSEHCVKRCLRTIVVRFFGLIFMAVMLATLYGFIRFHVYLYKQRASVKHKGVLQGSGLRRPIVLGAAATAATLALFIWEWIFKKISYCLTRFENHRTHVAFIRSLSSKYFVLSICFTFPVLVYIAFIKGFFFTTPEKNLKPKVNITFPADWMDSQKVNLPEEIGNFIHFTCGLDGCLEEAAEVFLILIIVRLIMVPGLQFVWRFKTDYTQGKKVVTTVPCWEREYRLKTITEEHMVHRFNEIALQFAIATLFSNILFSAPIVALLVNFWNIKYTARRFLLCSRRAMLFHFEGVGILNSFLYALVLLLPLFQILTHVRFYGVYTFTPDENRTYYNPFTPLSEYPAEKHPGKPKVSTEKCLFYGMYEEKTKDKTAMPWPFEWYNETDNSTKLMPKVQMYEGYRNNITCLIMFTLGISAFLAILRNAMPSESTTVHENMCMERTLKRMHLHNIKYEEMQKEEAKRRREEEQLKKIEEANKKEEERLRKLEELSKGEGDRKRESEQNKGDGEHIMETGNEGKGEQITKAKEMNKGDGEEKKEKEDGAKGKDEQSKEAVGQLKGEAEQTNKVEEHTKGDSKQKKEKEEQSKEAEGQHKEEAEQPTKIEEQSKGNGEQKKEKGEESKGQSEQSKEVGDQPKGEPEQTTKEEQSKADSEQKKEVGGEDKSKAEQTTKVEKESKEADNEKKEKGGESMEAGGEQKGEAEQTTKVGEQQSKADTEQKKETEGEGKVEGEQTKNVEKESKEDSKQNKEKEGETEGPAEQSKEAVGPPKGEAEQTTKVGEQQSKVDGEQKKEVDEGKRDGEQTPKLGEQSKGESKQK